MSSEPLSHESSDSIDRSLCVSFDGYEFAIGDYSWKLNRDISIPIGKIKKFLDDERFEGFSFTLADFAISGSAHYAANIYECYLGILHFARFKPVDEKLIINYRAEVGRDKEWRLSVIRVLFKRWLSLGFKGCDKNLVDLLNGWTLKGNVKGDAVKRLDPSSGALSDVELQGVLESTAQAYEQGILSITELSLVSLAAASGRRSVQLTSLRIGDLISRYTKDGSSRYFVNVPRAKQRGSGFRADFREVEVNKELWRILNVQKDYAIDSLASRLDGSLPEQYITEIPLYMSNKRLNEIKTVADLKRVSGGDHLHMTSKCAASLLKRAVGKTQLYSERTGMPLQLSPRRLRYTLGTRAAREGYGVLIIAELLDHTDIQNAAVYTQNVPEYATRIDEAVGHQMAHYAQAFAGVLVDDKTLAKRGDVLGSDIRNFSGQGAGTCGHYGFCTANVPVPCYTCIHFQPWLDGPHELVYKQLLQERDYIISLTGDLAVASALDRSIIAVAEVIQACDSRRANRPDSAKENPDG